MLDGWDGVLPNLGFGHLGSDESGVGAHVAVGQLVPGPCVGVSELGGVGVEPPRDALVVGVEPQGEVGGEHHWGVAHVGVLGVGDGPCGLRVAWRPLLGACGALGEFPLVVEEVVKEVRVPRNWVGGPRPFGSAGNGVVPVAGPERVLPPEPLLFDGCRLGFGTDEGGVSRSVGFAEGVATGDEGDRFLVVHRHAAEGFANVACGGDRVGHAVGAFRVHVDEAHLHGGQWVGEVPVAAVSLVIEPRRLRTPVRFVGFPHVGSAAAETEHRQPHGFHGDIAGEDHEVGPRDLASVLFFYRPKKTPGFVQVGVIGPAVERGESLQAGTTAAATVADAVGAGTVPGHADEQRSVMAVVGGPPVLRGGHDLAEVGFDGVEVQGGELGGVVEILTHGVCCGRVGVEDPEVQLFRPPVAVGGT